MAKTAIPTTKLNNPSGYPLSAISNLPLFCKNPDRFGLRELFSFAKKLNLEKTMKWNLILYINVKLAIILQA